MFDLGRPNSTTVDMEMSAEEGAYATSWPFNVEC
jgi:hypothetical protein